MNKKTVLSMSVGMAMGIVGGAANAFPGFENASSLTIDLGGVVAGTPTCTHDTVTLGGACLSTALTPSSLGGSYFFMGAGYFGTTFVGGWDGILLNGAGQPAGTGSHLGDPAGPGTDPSGPACWASDTGAITAPWGFFNNCGHEFAAGTGIHTSAATSDPNALSNPGQTLGLTHPNVDGHHFLDFSNWRVTWSGIPSIAMSGGLQDCGTSTDGICDQDGAATTFPDFAGTFFNGSGLAHVECFTDSAHTTPRGSCSASSFYVAEYAAIVPVADPSGFGGVLYEITLSGQVVGGVPVPAAAWLFGSGLLGLVGVARRRKAIKKA